MFIRLTFNIIQFTSYINLIKSSAWQEEEFLQYFSPIQLSRSQPSKARKFPANPRFDATDDSDRATDDVVIIN